MDGDLLPWLLSPTAKECLGKQCTTTSEWNLIGNAKAAGWLQDVVGGHQIDFLSHLPTLKLFKLLKSTTAAAAILFANRIVLAFHMMIIERFSLLLPLL